MLDLLPPFGPKCKRHSVSHAHPLPAPHSNLDSDAALPPLARLRELHIEDCGLRSLAGAARLLPGATLLVASGNRLADGGGEAERLSNMTSLREVALAGNPLARRPVRLCWQWKRLVHVTVTRMHAHAWVPPVFVL